MHYAGRRRGARADAKHFEGMPEDGGAGWW